MAIMSAETTAPLPKPRGDARDDTIRRTVKAFIAGFELDHKDVIRALDVSSATFYRRLDGGGFSAREVATLAKLFRVEVNDLFSGLDGRFVPRPPDRPQSDSPTTWAKRSESGAVIIPFPGDRVRAA